MIEIFPEYQIFIFAFCYYTSFLINFQINEKYYQF